MKTPFLPLTLLLCLTCLMFSCEDDDSQEGDRIELDALKTSIEDLAATSVCSETAECKFIGLGSKPCGGPWEYLIYSTSIDVEQLEDLVEDYNKKEADFNAKWGIASDCALANPPSSINCENNRCVAVF